MTMRDQQDFDPIYREQLSRLRALVQEGKESLDAPMAARTWIWISSLLA
jgi:hypothetical protein